MGPRLKGSFWSLLTPVKDFLNSKKNDSSYSPLHRGPGYLLGMWLWPFYDLGAQKFFLANNGLGAFLEPNWKVFHHGNLRNQFQGVCVAIGTLPISEKMEYPGRKVAQLLHLTEWQQDIINTCKGYQIHRHEKLCQYMRRNLKKVKFLTDFKGNFSIFYDFFGEFLNSKGREKKGLRVALEKQGGKYQPKYVKKPYRPQT